MDDSMKRKFDGLGQIFASDPESVGSIFPEQQMSPAPTLMSAIVRGRNDSFSTGYHWTVRSRRSDMTSRTASILLKILAVELVNYGIDFTGYLSTEYLVSYILRGKLDPTEIRDEKDKQACLLGYLILASCRGTWLSLGERIKISEAVVHDIGETGWLPSDRTLQSWKQYWKVRDFIEVLTVPMDTYMVDRDRSSTPYSSYCKGYGDGGHLSRVKKTPYDSELDGEESEREPPAIRLLEFEKYSKLLLSIEREKIRRLQEDKRD